MYANMIRQYVNELNLKLQSYKIQFYEVECDNNTIIFNVECTNHLISNKSSIEYNEELKYIFEENIGYKCIWSKHYTTVTVSF